MQFNELITASLANIMSNNRVNLNLYKVKEAIVQYCLPKSYLIKFNGYRIVKKRKILKLINIIKKFSVEVISLLSLYLRILQNKIVE